ncbi:hypothetical protein C6497_11595 [Candidatus Poribacteria bacterium]|nr:MAG: hypothetical protein C6497_11595 [Candidatus Poribacteria bacterium]
MLIDFVQFILNLKYISVVWVVAIIICTIIVYTFITLQMRKYVDTHAYKPENSDRFFFIWRYSFMFVITVIIIFLFSDTFGLLGLSLGFIMTVLSWGLRNPIMNLAAWLLIILKKPYQIGDRVILGQLIGDVKKITVMHTILDQVGGTISSEEKSGRSILIANLHLFNWTVVNYTRDEKYILDEVILRLTYKSNIDKAEQIMCQKAAEVTADICAELGEQPYVRFEFIPSGVVAKLRYRVVAVERPQVSTLIVEEIYRMFANENDIQFAYIKQEIELTSYDTHNPPPQYLHV